MMGFEKSREKRDNHRADKKEELNKNFVRPKSTGGIKKHKKTKKHFKNITNKKRLKKYSKKNIKYFKNITNKKYFKNITNKKKVKNYNKTMKKYKKYRK